MIVPLYMSRGARTEYSNYNGIRFLSVVGKIYGRIQVDRVRKMSEGLTDDKQGGFRAGRLCKSDLHT